MAQVKVAADVAVDVIARLWADWEAHEQAARNNGTKLDLFNVNLPLGCGSSPDVYLTEANRDSYSSLYQPKVGGSGELDDILRFQFSTPVRNEDAPAGTDRWALNQNAVSVSPLQAAFGVADLDAQA